MALERVGIGGVLKFSADSAITGMKRAGKAFGALKKRAEHLNHGVMMLGMGAAMGTAAMTAVAGGFVFAGKQAADFESQMSGVNSILDETNRQKMPELTALAKKMGAETIFSATQAGQGIEAMARSGANAADIMDGLGGVLNAAAADGIDLGTASSIVSNIVNAMGLTFKDATRVADVLAKTSSKSNTNILALGESFKFAAAQSSKMGIDLETTAAALGAIADSGLKGTLGGTSFTNMLVKLSKPSREAKKFMDKFSISLTDTDGRMRDVFDITKDFSAALGTVKNDAERARLSTEIFGIRGDKAFSAISKSLAKTGPKNLLALREAIRNSAGAAKEMAKLRLDNLAGSFTLFKSAAEGLFIEVFTPLLPLLKTGLDKITSAIQGVVKGIQSLSNPLKKSTDGAKKFGSIYAAISSGILEGISATKSAWNSFTSSVRRAGDYIKEKIGVKGVKAIASMLTKVGLISSAFLPIIIVMGGIVAFISMSLIPAITGIIAVAEAVGQPIAIAATIGLIAWGLFGKQIKEFISGLRVGLIPLIGVLKQSWADLSNALGIAFNEVTTAINQSSSGIIISWKTVGEVVGTVLVTTIATISDLIVGITLISSSFVKFVLPVGKMIFKSMFLPLRTVFEAIFNIKDAVSDVFGGSFLQGLAKVGLAIFDFVLKPLRTAIEIFGLMGSAVGFDLPDSLKKFAAEGLTGLAFGAPEASVSPAAAPRPTLPKKAPSPAAKAAAESAKNSKSADKTMESLKDAIRALPEKQKIDIKNNLCIDGREVSIASEKHKVELQERAGFKATPWQRRMAIEAGGVPVAAAG